MKHPKILNTKLNINPENLKRGFSRDTIKGFGLYLKDWIKYYFSGIFKEFNKKPVFFYSSALTFDLILCIIPFILIIFSYVGSILKSKEAIKQVNLIIEKLIPSTVYSKQIQEIISDRIFEFIEYQTLAGILGGIGVLITCTALFGSMRTILNAVFDIQQEKSIVIAKLRDLGMVVIVILFFYAMLLFNPLLEIGLSLVNEVEILNQYLAFFINSFFVDVIIIGITFTFFYLVFALIPYERLSNKVYLFSAIWASLLFELAKFGFKYYINNLVNYSHIYGNFTFLLVLALWFYISSVIFIFSAILGQLYRVRKSLMETYARKDITFKQIYTPVKIIYEPVENTIKKTFKKSKKKKIK